MNFVCIIPSRYASTRLPGSLYVILPATDGTARV